jgi:hypothetical protein
MSGSTLALNPNAKIYPIDENGQTIAYRIIAPVKGRGLVDTTVQRDDQALFAAIGNAPARVPFAVEAKEGLEKIGLYVAEERISLPVVFSNFFEWTCPDLFPAFDLAESQHNGDETRLMVNPRFFFDGVSTVPAEISYRIQWPGSFLSGNPVAWLEDPGTKILIPYWIKGEDLPFFLDLKKTRRIPLKLDRAKKSMLMATRFLVPHDYASLVGDFWESICFEARGKFKSDHYVNIGRIVTPFLLAAVRRYFRRLVEEGYLVLGDHQVERRHIAHNNDVSRFLHYQMTELGSRVAGAPLKPSYVYFSSYEPGSVLKKHTDREQCEISISFLVDFQPEPHGVTRWPLFLEKDDERRQAVCIYQKLGDALIYRGRRLPHWREALPDGCSSSSMFFHYVLQDFEGPLR